MSTANTIQEMIDSAVKEEVLVVEEKMEEELTRRVELALKGVGRPQVASFNIPIDGDGKLLWKDARLGFDVSNTSTILASDGTVVTPDTDVAEVGEVFQTKKLSNG